MIGYGLLIFYRTSTEPEAVRGKILAHRGLALTKRRLMELSPKTRSDLPG